MEVQIHYELAALTFMLAATLVFFRQRHLRVYRSSLFFWLMALGVVTAVCDVFCGITDLKQIPFTAGIVAHTLLFIASLVYSIVYSMYAMELLHRLDYIRDRKVLWCIPFVIGIILIMTTPFTGVLYTYDEQGMYHRGVGFYSIALITLLYVMVPWILMRRVSFVPQKTKRWIIAIPVAVVTARILQYVFFPRYLFAYAVNSVVLFCCYLFLQNSDYYMDEVTGFFKMHGFEETVREKMVYKEECSVLILRIINYNAMTEMYEDSKLTAIQAAMAELMQRECGDQDFYHIAASTFAIILPNE